MSSNVEQADEVCASCGIAAGDDAKLLLCTACKLVKYCSVECQKSHRKQHKKACKKRLAEIREETLFTQSNGSCYGECPICCLPLSVDLSKSGMYSCCCKRICGGCSCANQKREMEQGLEQKCPYCREPLSDNTEEVDQNYVERAKANDPFALLQMGHKCYHDEGEYDGAFEYYSKAAKLGNMDAQYELSRLYYEGRGIEKDAKMQVYYLEEAAIGGHPDARYVLGLHEWSRGRDERAMKHYIIAANLGHDDALDKIKQGFAEGFVSKDDYDYS